MPPAQSWNSGVTTVAASSPAGDERQLGEALRDALDDEAAGVVGLDLLGALLHPEHARAPRMAGAIQPSSRTSSAPERLTVTIAVSRSAEKVSVSVRIPATGSLRTASASSGTRVIAATSA